MIKLAPSLLAADFSCLDQQIKIVENSGADYLHLDVMDGVFVPNISFGIPVISSIRKKSKMVFDTHLMIIDPIRYVEAFSKAGADIITFHYESCENRQEVIDLIHSYGKKAGMSVKPHTDAALLSPYIDSLDLVLVMTVEPGFGGQKFMYEAMPNLECLNKLIKESGRDIDLEVDGGITLDNVDVVTQRGANVIVAGSSVFKAQDISKTVNEFKKR